MSDFLIDSAFVVSALGFWLFLALLAGAVIKNFRASARYLLKRGSLVGALTAALMAIVFIVMPDISMPGPGNLAVIAAMFFAGFAGTVPVLLGLRLLRQ
jgi:hypothetical protein